MPAKTPTKFRCTECDVVHATKAAAARCHRGIGGVVEVTGPENFIDRCYCGCKYWQDGRCIDCGGTEAEPW